MKGKELSKAEIEALNDGTKVYCVWDNWVGKGEGIFTKDDIGVAQEKGDNGWYYSEIETGLVKVYEFIDIDKISPTPLYAAAIDAFGPHSQLFKAIEELGELISALARFLNNEDHNVEEEIADVEIMKEQLKLLFDIFAIGNYKSDKLKRLEQRINKKLSEKNK